MTIQVFGAQATVSALNRAFTDTSPANAIFNNQVARAEKIGDQAFANEFGASFASLSNAELSKKVLTNLGVLPSTEASVVALEQAVTDYFAAFGAKTTASNGQVTADTRGFIVLQLASILSGLENATGSLSVYAATALAWNSEVANSYSYSSNVNNTTPTQTGTTGQSLTLTVNQDTINGGTGDDTINSPVNIAASTMTNTLQSVDTIDGGTGNDTLNVTLGEGTTNAIFVTPSMNNVENVVVRFASAVPSVLDLGSSTGVTSFTANNSTTTGILKDIGAIASLGIKNQNAGLTIAGTTNSATTVALNLDTVGTKTESAVNPITLDLGGNVASKVTTANITANNAYVKVDSTVSDVITTAAITATGTNTLLFTDSASTLTKITATGDGSVNLMGTPAAPNTIGLSKVTTLDASALKGALTAEVTNTAKAVTITTGAGNDYVKAPLVAITGSTANMGAGDDVLILGNNLGAFDKANGGEGTDIINITNGLTNTALNLVPAATESAVVTWADNTGATIGDTVSAGGLVITINTPAAATDANLATVAAGGAVNGLTLTGAPTGWTVASAGNTTTFTSTSVNTSVADITLGKTGAGSTIPTAVITQGAEAQAAVTASAYKNISNFETLDISGTKLQPANNNVVPATTYNLALNNFPTVQIDEAIAGSLQGAADLTNAPDVFALNIASKKVATNSAATSFTTGAVVTVAGKDYTGTTAGGDAETFSLVAKLLDGNKDGTIQGNIVSSGITVASVENLNITATATVDGGTTTASNVASNYLLTPTLTTTDVETITIKGDASVDFRAGVGSAKVTSVDASASTGNITATAAYSTNASIKYLGAAGIDTYTASGKGDMLYTAKGGDQITLAGGRDTLVYKAVSDSQITDISKDGKLTIGNDMGVAGTIGGGVYTATPTATIDTVLQVSVTINGAATLVPTFQTAGAGSGAGGVVASDRIDVTNFGFTGVQRGVENVTTKVTSTTDLTSITGLFSSAAGNRGVAFSDIGGDAYVFIDANKDGNFTGADDLVIKLAGVVGAGTTGLSEADFNF